MSEESRGEPIVALDYTSIVRHRGKQFTVGDLSLSKIGGVDLHAAGLSLVPAVVVGAISFVLFFILGITLFIATLPALAVWIGGYLWFARDVIDSQPPLYRILMAFSVRRNSPVVISGGGPTVRHSNMVSELIGTKHHAADLYPTELHWAVIVKRADDPAHRASSPALPNRQSYRPKPRGIDLAVHDDVQSYDEWADFLAQSATRR